MNLLNALHQLLGAHAQAPQQLSMAQKAQPIQPGQLYAHQAPQQQLGNNTVAAQLYAHNPMDPRVMHMDPAQFGYPADNSGMRLAVAPNAYRANLGVPYGGLQQGNAYNPGYTPVQGSTGVGAFPQVRAYSNLQSPQLQVNPQLRPTQQLWQ